MRGAVPARPGGCGDEVAFCAGEVAVQGGRELPGQDQPHRPHQPKSTPINGNRLVARS